LDVHDVRHARETKDWDDERRADPVRGQPLDATPIAMSDT
jgi:hypothetical protein